MNSMLKICVAIIEAYSAKNRLSAEELKLYNLACELVTQTLNDFKEILSDSELEDCSF